MKKHHLYTNLGTYLLAACAAAVGVSLAGDKEPTAIPSSGKEFEKTKRDLPGAYGETYTHRRAHNGKIAKLDLDGDFNYDGTISNDDPSDNGEVQQTAPGLYLGTGELTRMVIRLSPYQIDIQAKVRLELEVVGINRGDRSGEFRSLDEELSSMGHIRVWADAKRSQLLLDSQKSDSRVWSIVLPDLHPETVVQNAPRAIWVEGVKPSGSYAGDIRLMVRIMDVRGDKAEKGGLTGAIAGMGFRPSFDHVLLTVGTSPHKKAFVNNNAEGVWSSGGGSSK